LLEIAEASLKRNGCTVIPVQLDKGGMYAFSQFGVVIPIADKTSSAILHPRLAFQILEGFTNAYGLEIPGRRAEALHR